MRLKPTYPQKPIIVVVGPTASGKSDLAVELALRLSSGQAKKKFGIKGAEIISADSRQVYRGMNLGTGKITKKEMAGIPHHLLDVASPKRRFTVAQYKKLAQAAIKKIQSKNKIPIVCGGTGFYIQSLVDDLKIPAVKPNLKLRARLEKIATKELYKKLQKLDPRRAKAIDPQNPRRLVRALEIVMTTGQPIPLLNPPKVEIANPLKSDFKSSPKSDFNGYNSLFLGIQKSRPELARRIKTRLQKRFKQGMLAEVKKLRAQGLSWKRLDDFGLEYRWLAKYLQKKISRQEMTTRLQKDIEHYAKRQMTWFKRDPRIYWLNNYQTATKLCQEFINKNSSVFFITSKFLSRYGHGHKRML